MKIQNRINRKPRVEMLPLIDIVFLLLVFFIYSIMSMAVHRGLPVVLPKSSTAKIERSLVLSVTVKSDGSIYVDKERVPLDDLKDYLRQKARDEKETGILLFADQGIPYQRLFKVLDQIWLAGLSKVSLQAEVER